MCYGISDNNRRRVPPGRTHRLAVALAIVICLASAPPSQAQLPHSAAQSPAKPAPTARIDPLGRETPRSAMLGFLKYALLEDYETAARYGVCPGYVRKPVIATIVQKSTPSRSMYLQV